MMISDDDNINRYRYENESDKFAEKTFLYESSISRKLLINVENGYEKSIHPSLSSSSLNYRHHNSLKIIILGDKNVGKTTFINNTIITMISDDDDDVVYKKEKNRGSTYKNNILNDVTHLELETEEYGKVRLHIWDTVGEEYSNAVTTNIFRNANGIIILYDITNRKSFDNVLKRWIPRIKILLGEKGFINNDDDDDNKNTEHDDDNIFKLLIVANKTDLSSDRVVTDDECKQLTDLLKLPYIQLSTLHDNHDTILLPFILLTKMLIPFHFRFNSNSHSYMYNSNNNTIKTTSCC